MESSLDNILALLLQYKYLILFPISVIEGPIISILAGVLIAQNLLNPWITWTLLVIGDIVGDTLYYCLGRYGGRPFIKKHGHLLRLREEKMTQWEEHFHHKAPKRTLFLGKTQPWGSVILFAAGATKMPYLKFLLINTVASIPKALLLILIGYYFNEAYIVMDRYLQYTGIILTIIGILIVLYFFLKKKK